MRLLLQSVIRRGLATRRMAIPARSWHIGGQTPASYFSTTVDQLVSALDREAQEEIDLGNNEMPEELKSLQSTLEASWRIVDEADSGLVQLYGKNKKVQVSFHCQDSVESVDDIYEDDFDEEEEEESPMVRFTVTTSKAGKSLVINCVADAGEVRIESVATTAEPVDAIHASQGTLANKAYQGPEFLELDEDLQAAFADVLEEDLLVNKDLAAFVGMYTDYKEQILYTQFLEDVKTIMS